jgi:putative transposase
VNAHPTAEWTLQPFWEALPGDDRYRFVIHDRDSIFSKGLDQAVNDLGVRVLRTPLRAPWQTLYVNDSAGPYAASTRII